MLPIFLEALLALEEGFVLAGRASLFADAILGANALRAGRLVPSTIRASKSLANSWHLATRVANQINNVTDTKAYADVRALTRELEVMHREFEIATKMADNPRLYLGKQVDPVTQKPMALEYPAGFTIPREFAFDERAEPSKDLFSLVAANKVTEYASTPYVLKRLAATYAGKQLIDRWTANALNKSEALNLYASALSRTLAKELVIKPVKGKVEAKFDAIARGWIDDVNLNSSTQGELSTQHPTALMLHVTKYKPIASKPGVPLTQVRLQTADYARFSHLVLRNAVRSATSLQSWLSAVGRVPLTDLATLNTYNASRRL